MAKAAKSVEVEITERRAKKFLADILERFENIDSARGKYMNAARKERDAMTALYEGMAHLGISQKATKANVKIARALEKIKGWMADLEIEDRKLAQKLAKAQGDKRQLMLFGELPAAPKPAKKAKEPKEFPGVTGDDLTEAMEAAGSA